MEEVLKSNDLILIEAAVVEQVRRSHDIDLHESLVHAPLIYDEKGKAVLKSIYQSYIDVAFVANMPIILCTPTWRANSFRVLDANINQLVNVDAVRFMQSLRKEQNHEEGFVRIAGLIGCKNDCYLPEEGLTAKESEKFHSWQINQLVKGGVDLLMAVTLPSIDEAIGIAKVMESTTLPYVISFVIDKHGLVLDGTALLAAMKQVDESVNRKPLGYMVNCSYPSFLCAEKQPKELYERLIGFQANASSLDHDALDGSESLKTESVDEWGQEMLKLHKDYGLKILGGCCGTGVEHLEYLSKEVK